MTQVKYKDGVTAPTIDPVWPWVLQTVIQKKDSEEIVEHKAQGLSTSQVSKLQIAYATGKQIFEFRRGRPLRMELEDAFVTYTLNRQPKGKLENGDT